MAAKIFFQGTSVFPHYPRQSGPRLWRPPCHSIRGRIFFACLATASRAVSFPFETSLPESPGWHLSDRANSSSDCITGQHAAVWHNPDLTVQHAVTWHNLPW